MQVSDIYDELDDFKSLDVFEYTAEERERIDYLEDKIAEIEELAPAAQQYGLMMIPEREFEDYARQFADDIGAFSVLSDHWARQGERRDVSGDWPFTCIDWQRAAEELAQDYTEIEFDGVTYYCQEV